MGVEGAVWRPHCQSAKKARLARATGTRERFTMDEGCSKAVREVFVNLYEKGLIYQGKRIINWCPHCTHSLCPTRRWNITEQAGHFWHIKYPDRRIRTAV